MNNESRDLQLLTYIIVCAILGLQIADAITSSKLVSKINSCDTIQVTHVKNI